MEAVKKDYRQAPIDTATRRMLEFAERVTRAAAQMEQKDVETLRQAGFSDEAILDIAHITGYFNHINRVADALGVDPENFMITDEGQRTD